MKRLDEVTDIEFDSVLANNKYVLIDFWADWCIPCRQVSPIVEDIANERPEITVFKMNIDANPDTPKRFGVMSIPTLIFFEQGVERARVVGVKTKEQILNALAN